MRLFGYFLISVASLGATALGLRVFLPAPQIDGIAVKIQFIHQHRDELDTLFIGSSRVYHGVNPRIFDETTAAAGIQTHSYNFGVDAMLPPETFYVADQILAAKPRKLRWVFIELEDVQVTVSQEHARTQRALSWHDWKRTWLVTQKLLNLDVQEKWKQKRNRFLQNRNALAMHFGLLLKKFANSGRVFDLTQWYPQEEDASQLEYEPRGDGYAPTMVPMDGERRVRYEAWVANDPASAKPRETDRYADRAFRHYVEGFRSIGATPIFFVTPGSRAFLPSKFIGAQPAAVLAFNDARAFPSLYFASSRIDEAHLNAAGADEFTKLLALRFLSWKRDAER
ncbi:MAG: hypothetical protein WAO00_13535 [Chthoniobacterales bacterium]